MNKIFVWLGVAIIAVVAVVLLVNRGGSTPQATESPVVSSSPEASGEMMMHSESVTPSASPTPGNVKEFTVTGSNFNFDLSVMKVKKGDTVKVTFKNSNGTHDWRLDEFGVATKLLQTGGQETVEFVADKIGSFEYYCSVGQHRALGMKGLLIVE